MIELGFKSFLTNHLKDIISLKSVISQISSVSAKATKFLFGNSFQTLISAIQVQSVFTLKVFQSSMLFCGISI
jgi:hypothetical protein